MNSIIDMVLPVYVVRIRIPLTLALTFEKTFKVDSETTEEFQKISHLRRDLVTASERFYAQSAVDGVNKYLPCLFGLMQAVEKLPPDFCKSLRISWTGSCLSDTQVHHHYFTHFDWNFEVLYVLLTYGLLFRKLAFERLCKIPDENFDEMCQEPTRLLREAAGIFEYVSANVSTKFFPSINDYPLPEMVGETFLLLSNISQAESQSIVLKKAIMTSKSCIILAKLCSGISNLYENANTMFEGIKKGKPSDFFYNPPLQNYIHLNKELYAALAFKFMGIHFSQSGEMGKGVAYLWKAKSILEKTKIILPPAPSLPFSFFGTKHTTSMEDIIQFWSKFETERDFICTLYKEFSKDNLEIYHDKVPDQETVTLPSPKLMSTPLKFQPPDPITVNVTPSKAGLCNIL